MVAPLRLSRPRADKKGKQVPEEEDTFEKRFVRNVARLSLVNWRDSLPEETRRLYRAKLFRTTSTGVDDGDAFRAVQLWEDDIYKDATSLSDYKTRMAIKYDAVTPTTVCGQSPSSEIAQRIFLTAQTYFDDDNFRFSLDPPEPQDTSEAREVALKVERRRVITHPNFSSTFGHDCGLLGAHRRLARAVHSASSDFFGGRLRATAEAFKAHFKASDANRKAATADFLGPDGQLQASGELQDLDRAIESFYAA